MSRRQDVNWKGRFVLLFTLKRVVIYGETSMLTKEDIEIVLGKVKILKRVNGFSVDDDGVDSIALTEQMFGKADIYGVADDRILTAYWFV